MDYAWRHLRFTAPEGRDDSSILIVDPADPPSWNLSLRLDPLPAGASAFSLYVAQQKPSAGAKLDGRTERTVGGRPAVVFKSHLDGPQAVLRQQQVLILDQSRVLVVTMTSTDGAARRAQTALESLLSSLSFGDPT